MFMREALQVLHPMPQHEQPTSFASRYFICLVTWGNIHADGSDRLYRTKSEKSVHLKQMLLRQVYWLPHLFQTFGYGLWLWILFAVWWVSTVLSVAVYQCCRDMLGIWPVKLSSVKVWPFGGVLRPKMGLSFKWSDLAQKQASLFSNLFPNHSSWNLQKLDHKLHAWLSYIPHEMVTSQERCWQFDHLRCRFVPEFLPFRTTRTWYLSSEILICESTRVGQFKYSATKKKCIQ